MEKKYDIIERCLLPTMLGTAVEALQRRGTTVRADILNYLNRAAVAPLSTLHPSEVSLYARYVVKTSDTLLKTVNEDDLQTVLLIVCLFIEKLVDEGLFDDRQNQAVLAALLIVTEAKEDEGAGWPGTEARLLVKAGDLLRRAQLLGYFLKLNLALMIG